MPERTTDTMSTNMIDVKMAKKKPQKMTTALASMRG